MARQLWAQKKNWFHSSRIRIRMSYYLRPHVLYGMARNESTEFKANYYHVVAIWNRFPFSFCPCLCLYRLDLSSFPFGFGRIFVCASRNCSFAARLSRESISKYTRNWIVRNGAIFVAVAVAPHTNAHKPLRVWSLLAGTLRLWNLEHSARKSSWPASAEQHTEWIKLRLLCAKRKELSRATSSAVTRFVGVAG